MSASEIIAEIIDDAEARYLSSSFVDACEVRAADAEIAPSSSGPQSQTSKPRERRHSVEDMWDWASGRMADDSLHRIHSARQVHGDKGAFVGGGWVDIEDCADYFNIQHGSDKRHAAECKGACEKCPRSRSRISAAKSDGTYDIIIIGAGCIGSAIARELSKTTASVLVLEAADDVTQGATKGNSGIIHAGFDDKPGSMRAKYCWPGNQMFPDLDRELHFGFQRNGSLVVATNADDIPLLYELMKRGEQNGVKNLRIVDDINELHQLEPAIDKSAVAALLSPDAVPLSASTQHPPDHPAVT